MTITDFPPVLAEAYSSSWGAGQTDFISQQGRDFSFTAPIRHIPWAFPSCTATKTWSWSLISI